MQTPIPSGSPAQASPDSESYYAPKDSPHASGSMAARQVTPYKPDPNLSLPKLEVRHSDVPGAIGLGLFTRKRKAEDTEVIFHEGEKIMDISGTLAMRKKQHVQDKSLTWLVCNNYCHPVSDDSRIIWSDIHYPKQDDVEFGCYPKNIAIYSNDSQATAPNVQINSLADLSKPPVKKPRRILPEECPTYEMVALEDIPPDTELFWSYGKEGKEETDYEGSYLEKYERHTHARTIANKTRDVLDMETSPVIIEDGSEFNLIRIIQESQSKPYIARLEPYEWAFCNEHALSENGKPSTAFLSHALRCKMIDTYIKFRIEWITRDGYPLTASLEFIERTFKEASETSHPELKKIIKPYITLTTIYSYCVDNGILNPEDDILNIPYVWLRRNLEKDPNSVKFNTLLIRKISILLTQAEMTPSQIATILTRERIPHPISREPQWSYEDLESLTLRSYHRPTNQKEIDDDIDTYLSSKQHEIGNHAFKIYDYARAGNIPALKAIIKRRLTSPDRILEVARDLKGSKIKLPISGSYCISDKKSLTAFIKEKFSRDEYCDGMLNYYEIYSLEELLLMMKSGSSGDSFKRLALNFLKKLKGLEQGSDIHKKYSIAYIVVSLEKGSKQSLHDAIKLLDNTTLLKRKAKREDVIQLLEGEEETLKLIAPASTAKTTDDFIELFLTTPAGKGRTSLLKEIKSQSNSEEIIKRCIIADYNHKIKKGGINNSHMGNVATMLKKNGFTLEGKPHSWKPSDIRTMLE